MIFGTKKVSGTVGLSEAVLVSLVFWSPGPLVSLGFWSLWSCFGLSVTVLVYLGCFGRPLDTTHTYKQRTNTTHSRQAEKVYGKQRTYVER